MAQTKVQLLMPNLGDVIDFDSSTLFMDGADNRVGIRNTNPQYELDVTGTVNATNFRGNISVGTIDDWITHTGDTNTKFGFPSNDTFTVETGGSERIRFDASGKTFIHGTGATGSNNTSTRLPNGNTLNIHGTSSNDGISIVRYSADFGAFGINIGKSNNSTFGTNTLVTNGEELGHITFYGADGTDFNHAAQITALVNGTPSDGTDMPGALSFRTSAEGSATPTERLRIDSSGRVLVSTTTEGHGNADELTLSYNNTGVSGGDQGRCGLTIRSGQNTSSVMQNGYIYFSDGTSGGNEYRGVVGYNHNSDYLYFSSAATERMRITGDGPHLLLGGISDVNEITESSANAGMVIGGTGFGNAGLAIINSTTGAGRIYFGDATGSNAARQRGQINYYHSGDYMMFATAGSERLRIDSSGNIQLQGGTVYGDDSATATFKLQSTSGNSNHARIEIGAIQSSDNGGIHFYTAGSSAATRHMTLKGTSGNLGVGIDNPNWPLTVQRSSGTTTIGCKNTGGDSTVYVEASSGNTAKLTLFQAGTSGYSLQTGSTDALQIFRDSSERVRIDSTGRVGINGAGTKGMLEVRASGGDPAQLTAVFGANEGTTAGTLTDNADKACRIGVQHYDTNAKPFTFLVGSGTTSANVLNIGGGTSLMNGATEIRFSTDTATVNNGGTERLRIRDDGRTSINIDDARFGQSNSASGNKFYQNSPKLGVQGSIVIGNLSSTATDMRELAFYRRAGSTAGSAISNHHIGRIAWYGSSNDSSFPDMAWSLECTPNGGGWTAGSNRHGYLSFISGRNGEYMRLTSAGYLSVGFAGAPDTRLHIKGNSDSGTEDATLTIEDTDDTAGSKEPILAFDGNGTRQGRILSSDNTSIEDGGLIFGVGSGNNTVLQLNNSRGLEIHSDVRGWATVRYHQGTGIRTHVRMHYSPGNAVQQQTLLRIRRYWWGWGFYKIRCKSIYYNSSLESTFYVNGHGSGGNHYSITQEAFGGNTVNNNFGCTITHTASGNSPGGGSPNVWYADIIANIPNYTYTIFWIEAWGSGYSTDPTSMHYDSYCLM